MWPVLLIFLSYLDRNFAKGQSLSHSLDTVTERNEIFYMENANFCAKTSKTGGNHLHQMSDSIEAVRSVHDSAGNLVDCSVTNDQMQVKSFMHECRLGVNDQRGTSKRVQRSLTILAEAKATCLAFQWKSKHTGGAARSSALPRTHKPKDRQSSHGSATRESGQILSRVKRGFTYPGTLWCGAGNIADNYDHLGEFAGTDNCCRVHDHCPHVIHAFSRNYGYTNFKWHSLSHCACDNALKECLGRVNDTSSRVVGQAFFNVIEVPCFEFVYEEQCVERHWYGMCKSYDRVPIAVMKESIPYDFGGIEVIDELTVAPRVQKVPEGGQSESAEGTTRPTASSPQTIVHEEPSIGNVVTAAEDFIKVLATVSTSHSSSTEATKREVQAGERKRKRKKMKKKEEEDRRSKNKKKKGHKAGDVKAGDVMENNLSISHVHTSRKHHRNTNTLMGSFPGPEQKGEFSNKLMKGEPEGRPNATSDGTTGSSTVAKTESSELQLHGGHGHTGGGDLTATSKMAVLSSVLVKRSNERQLFRKNKIAPVLSVSALSHVRESDIETFTSTLMTASAQQSGSENHRELLITAPTIPVIRCLTTKSQKPKLGRENLRKCTSLSFAPSILQTTFNIPATDETEPAPEPKRNSTTATSPLNTININAAVEFTEREPAGRPEKASTASRTLSINHLETKKESKGRQRQKNKRKMASSLRTLWSTADISVTIEPKLAQNAKQRCRVGVTTLPTITTQNAGEFVQLSSKSQAGKGPLATSPTAPPSDHLHSNRKKLMQRNRRRKEARLTRPTSGHI